MTLPLFELTKPEVSYVVVFDWFSISSCFAKLDAIEPVFESTKPAISP